MTTPFKSDTQPIFYINSLRLRLDRFWNHHLKNHGNKQLYDLKIFVKFHFIEYVLKELKDFLVRITDLLSCQHNNQMFPESVNRD